MDSSEGPNGLDGADGRADGGRLVRLRRRQLVADRAERAADGRRRLLAITELSVSAYGPPGDITCLLSMRIGETGGQTALTISSLTVGFDGGRSVTVPIDSARLNPGASERLNDASFKDTARRPHRLGQREQLPEHRHG